MKKILIVEHELTNVSRRFKKAIWISKFVGRVYNSAKDASKYHNLRNCNYRYEDEDGNVLARYGNARVSKFGIRY